MKTYKDTPFIQRDVKQTMSLDDQPKIKGCDFSQENTLKNLLERYATTGFQATHLAKAIDIVNIMRREQVTIFLSCTSNIITSGLRDIITFLVQHKHIQAIVTTAGGIEEDCIKSLKPFVLGTFESNSHFLYEHGINRAGNVFIPNDRYTYFEQFMTPLLESLYEQSPILTTQRIIQEMGKRIDSEDSYLYWAYKHNIPVYCPALLDGSLGDMIYFFKQRHKDAILDSSDDIQSIVNFTLQQEKTGGIILGGGVPKHFTFNANIFKGGLDYCVMINTAQEYDGSDSGAQTSEAITWSKITKHAPTIKVHADATLVFPLLVSQTFAQQ